jgi:hypothetical protein
MDDYEVDVSSELSKLEDYDDDFIPKPSSFKAPVVPTPAPAPAPTPAPTTTNLRIISPAKPKVPSPAPKPVAEKKKAEPPPPVSDSSSSSSSEDESDDDHVSDSEGEEATPAPAPAPAAPKKTSAPASSRFVMTSAAADSDSEEEEDDKKTKKVARSKRAKKAKSDDEDGDVISGMNPKDLIQEELGKFIQKHVFIKMMDAAKDSLVGLEKKGVLKFKTNGAIQQAMAKMQITEDGYMVLANSIGSVTDGAVIAFAQSGVSVDKSYEFFVKHLAEHLMHQRESTIDIGDTDKFLKNYALVCSLVARSPDCIRNVPKTYLVNPTLAEAQETIVCAANYMFYVHTGVMPEKFMTKATEFSDFLNSKGLKGKKRESPFRNLRHAVNLWVQFPMPAYQRVLEAYIVQFSCNTFYYAFKVASTPKTKKADETPAPVTTTTADSDKESDSENTAPVVEEPASAAVATTKPAKAKKEEDKRFEMCFKDMKPDLFTRIKDSFEDLDIADILNPAWMTEKGPRRAIGSASNGFKGFRQVVENIHNNEGKDIKKTKARILAYLKTRLDEYSGTMKSKNGKKEIILIDKFANRESLLISVMIYNLVKKTGIQAMCKMLALSIVLDLPKNIRLDDPIDKNYFEAKLDENGNPIVKEPKAPKKPKVLTPEAKAKLEAREAKKKLAAEKKAAGKGRGGRTKKEDKLPDNWKELEAEMDGEPATTSTKRKPEEEEAEEEPKKKPKKEKKRKETEEGEEPVVKKPKKEKK